MLGLALCGLWVTRQRQLGIQPDFSLMPYEHSIEMDRECNVEIKLQPHSPKHRFGDLLSFATNDTKLALKRLKSRKLTGSKLYAEMKAIFWRPGAVMLQHHCLCCGVPQMLVQADVHLAGVSCTDWSSMGLQNKENGTQIPAILVWAPQRLLLLDPVVLVENVPQFKQSMLEDLLGEAYDIVSIPLCNTMFGMPGSRRRPYLLLTRRASHRLCKSIECLPLCFGRERDPQFRMQDLFVAAAAEKRV